MGTSVRLAPKTSLPILFPCKWDHRGQALRRKGAWLRYMIRARLYRGLREGLFPVGSPHT